MKHTQLCFAIAFALISYGCKKQEAAGPAGGPPPTQVVVAVAKVQPVSEKLSLVGSVAANESVEIKSESDGMVLEVLFTEGQLVEKGALLLNLDDRKLTAAADEADANFKLSKANYERAAQLLKDKLISSQEYDQSAATFQMNQAGLQLKREQLKDARIYAPFAGTVSTRLISPGQVISKNTTLTYLIDLDPVKVELNVPERFISQVNIGQEIEISVATFPDRSFKGKVFFVSPFVDPASRTALVKAEMPNPKAELKPGMFANLNLTLKVKDNAIVIPETALIPSGEKVVVYVIGDDGTAEARVVKIGMRMAGEVEIAEGLKSGERVVAEGVQKVRPGGKVKAMETAKP